MAKIPRGRGIRASLKPIATIGCVISLCFFSVWRSRDVTRLAVLEGFDAPQLWGADHAEVAGVLARERMHQPADEVTNRVSVDERGDGNARDRTSRAVLPAIIKATTPAEAKCSNVTVTVILDSISPKAKSYAFSFITGRTLQRYGVCAKQIKRLENDGHNQLGLQQDHAAAVERSDQIESHGAASAPASSNGCQYIIHKIRLRQRNIGQKLREVLGRDSELPSPKAHDVGNAPKSPGDHTILSPAESRERLSRATTCPCVLVGADAQRMVRLNRNQQLYCRIIVTGDERCEIEDIHSQSGGVASSAAATERIARQYFSSHLFPCTDSNISDDSDGSCVHGTTSDVHGSTGAKDGILAKSQIYVPLGPRFDFWRSLQQVLRDEERQQQIRVELSPRTPRGITRNTALASQRPLLFNAVFSKSTSPSRIELERVLQQHFILQQEMDTAAGLNPSALTANPKNPSSEPQTLQISSEHDFKYHIQIADQWTAQLSTHEHNHMQSISYANVVLRSRFTVCPLGHHPETFRLYEAMEAGSIPIMVFNTTEYQEHECSNALAPILKSLRRYTGDADVHADIHADFHADADVSSAHETGAIPSSTGKLRTEHDVDTPRSPTRNRNHNHDISPHQKIDSKHDSDGCKDLYSYYLFDPAQAAKSRRLIVTATNKIVLVLLSNWDDLPGFLRHVQDAMNPRTLDTIQLNMRTWYECFMTRHFTKLEDHIMAGS